MGLLPHQRANVDQVPLPFVNNMEETLEEKGADRVCINQNGPTLGKRQATAQVCFRPEVPLLPEGGDPAPSGLTPKRFLSRFSDFATCAHADSTARGQQSSTTLADAQRRRRPEARKFSSMKYLQPT